MKRSRFKPKTGILQNCLYCGKKFYVIKCLIGDAKYCSAICRDTGHRTKFCPKGHDKDVTGRTKTRRCLICRIDFVKAQTKNYFPQYHKKWYRKHKKKILVQQAKYTREKKAKDPIFKLTSRLRVRLWHALKRNFKAGSAVRDLGCTIPFFKEYIEKKFNSRMTWKNWGTYWELDHVKPLISFDLTNKKQFIKAVHYTNMQPLTKVEHKKKSAKERKKKYFKSINKIFGGHI